MANRSVPTMESFGNITELNLALGSDWWFLALDGILPGSYRPNAAKSLPLCKDLNVNELRSQWRATAVQPTVTEGVATVEESQTKIATSTQMSSVVDYTKLRTLTTTDAKGSPTIQVVTETTRAAVVKVALASASDLTRADKIALGVGLGIGLPTVSLMIFGLCLQYRAFKRSKGEQ
ncbi:hypothetical protein EK21DRAFT_116234 [Setomelanomma holmii]|uniref:Uncharacterized protein n=1 Tax=Setomelanomma holmii TaxID=210430 RepID=A0A9P4H2W9_9PLEO|nr:hypothetical protein EK21DRAFT_116234 [Setomelanomma holmii]